MLGIAAEGAFVVALLVYAYQLGGIVEVGLASLARTLPAGILAPFMAGLADHLPRHRLLVAVHASRGGVVALLALAATLGGGTALLLLLAAIEGILASLHRPSNAALLPALAHAPEELVASNVVSGAGENLGGLAGPAIAAGLVTIFGVGSALLAPAFAFWAAAVAIGLVRPAAQPIVAPGARRSPWGRALGGIAALREHPSAALLAGIGMTQTFVRGAMTVMLVAAGAQLIAQGGLVLTALLLPTVALVAAPAIRRADLAAVVPERQMRLLRGVSIFQPLPLTVVEQIAGSLEPMSFGSGQEVCTQGDPGDRFFIIDAGRAQVELTGAVVRHLEEGESFGEIALLRSVPRTATVRAEQALKTFALNRFDFVSAVTGNPQSAVIADSLIGERLTEDVGRSRVP